MIRQITLIATFFLLNILHAQTTTFNWENATKNESNQITETVDDIRVAFTGAPNASVITGFGSSDKKLLSTHPFTQTKIKRFTFDFNTAVDINSIKLSITSNDADRISITAVRINSMGLPETFILAVGGEVNLPLGSLDFKEVVGLILETPSDSVVQFGALVVTKPTTTVAQTSFGWENATKSGNIITETIDGITLTSTASKSVSIDDFFGVPPTGSSGFLLRTEDGTKTVTFSFNKPVNVASIFFSVVGGDNNLVFTPNSNNNNTVSISNAIIGRDADLNWTNVTSFTVTTVDGSFLLFDNLVITEAVLSTEDVLANTNFKVYPNPVKDNLHIDYDTPIESLEVFNNTGKLISSGKNITFKNLPQGIYLLRAKTQKGYITKKIIKE